MLRVRDETWDFRGETAKIGIHGIHTYPAMMLPQIAKRIIEEYGSDKSTVFDPFCGSGTVLVEGILNYMNAYGIDINPLAVLISEVKITPIDVDLLLKEYEKIEHRFRNVLFGQEKIDDVETPKFFNIDYWFKPSVIKQLAYIKSIIDEIEDEPIKNFFLVAFSETVRKSSNTRCGEYKLFRIPEHKLKDWNPNAISIFLQILNRNIKLSVDYYRSKQMKMVEEGKIQAKVVLHDVRKSVEFESDIVVTSPPYGDSRTTVAYGQFSRLSLQWLGFDYNTVKNIDSLSLGGIRAKRISSDVESQTLYEILDLILKKNKKRALDVYSFFKDFQIAFKRIIDNLTDNSVIALVVGNRTVCKITIPTDVIMAEIIESMGYKHVKTIVRVIPSKRLPKKSSPSNVKGDVVETMNKEYIVILKR